MKDNKYYFAKACTFYGKVVRKLSSWGFPFFDLAYQTFIKKIIKTDYADIIAKYQNIDYKPIPLNENYPIWIFWWQGKGNMPEVVKICYNSVLENAGKHTVHLITKDNYEEYISQLQGLGVILEKLHNGDLICAHFSDIIRCYLLYTYGGVWIDATTLITNKIDNIISNDVFVSGSRLPDNQNKYSITKGRWTTYFVFSNRGNLLFKFIDEILIRQVIDKSCLLDYFMLDFCFAIAYEKIPFVMDMQTASPVFPNRILDLMYRLNSGFNDKWYGTLTNSNPFLKLTYKKHFGEYTKTGKMTYYGYLKNRYL